MMRIVFDTNIVVSAMLSPSGTAADVLRLALNRHVQLCASEVILEEYEEVLRRPKFRRPLEAVSALMKAVRAVARLFEPTVTLTVSGDDADNRFLECAWPRARTSSSQSTPHRVTSTGSSINPCVSCGQANSSTSRRSVAWSGNSFEIDASVTSRAHGAAVAGVIGGFVRLFLFRHQTSYGGLWRPVGGSVNTS